MTSHRVGPSSFGHQLSWALPGPAQPTTLTSRQGQDRGAGGSHTKESPAPGLKPYPVKMPVSPFVGRTLLGTTRARHGSRVPSREHRPGDLAPQGTRLLLGPHSPSTASNLADQQGSAPPRAAAAEVPALAMSFELRVTRLPGALLREVIGRMSELPARHSFSVGSRRHFQGKERTSCPLTPSAKTVRRRVGPYFGPRSRPVRQRLSKLSPVSDYSPFVVELFTAPF